MKNYHNLIARMQRPLLVTPQFGAAAAHVLLQRMQGQAVNVEGLQIGTQEDDECQDMTLGNIAVIPVYGVIGKHLSSMERMWGGCDIDEVSGALEEAEADGNIDRILFDFRSPGGEVTGISECAELIANCTKLTGAFTDSQCCSAALWLAAQTDFVMATPSSSIGSVGVWTLYWDYTEQLKKDGIKANVFSDGEYKLMGAWFKEMTDAERAIIQSEISEIGEQFRSEVNNKRPVDSKYLASALCYTGKQAVEIGMADTLVSRMSEALEVFSQLPSK